MTGLHYYSLLWQVCYLNDTLWQFSCIYICWETTNLQPLLVWFAITVFTIPISLVRCFKQAHLRFLLKERCFENVLKSSLNARNEKKDIYGFFFEMTKSLWEKRYLQQCFRIPCNTNILVDLFRNDTNMTTWDEILILINQRLHDLYLFVQQFHLADIQFQTRQTMTKVRKIKTATEPRTKRTFAKGIILNCTGEFFFYFEKFFGTKFLEYCFYFWGFLDPV